MTVRDEPAEIQLDDGRDSSGRFTSAREPEVLLDQVCFTCMLVDPDDPLSTTVSDYNDHRPAGSRTAGTLITRFRMSWARIKAAAFEPDAGHRNRLLGLAVSDRSRKGYVLLDAVEAVRHVTLANGGKSPTPGRYDEIVERMTSRDRRSWLHGGSAETGLPTAIQIREVLSQQVPKMGWDDLMVCAGLPAAEHRSRQRGLDPLGAVRRFADDLGCVPSGPTSITSWAKARGYRIQTKITAAELHDAVAEYVGELEQQGEPVPPVLTPSSFDWSALDRAADADTQPGRKPRGYWLQREHVMRGIARAITLNGTATTFRQDDLQAWGRDPDVPTLKAVQRLAALEQKSVPQLIAEAREQWI